MRVDGWYAYWLAAVLALAMVLGPHWVRCTGQCMRQAFPSRGFCGRRLV